MQTVLKIKEKVFAVFKLGKLSFVPALVLIIAALPVNAEEEQNEQYCPDGFCVCSPDTLNFPASTTEPDADGVYPLALEADNVDTQGKEVVIMTGNAEVMQGRQSISADELKYYRETDQAEGRGNVIMRSQNGDWFKSDEANIHAPTHVGDATNVEYKLASRDGISSSSSNESDDDEYYYVDGVEPEEKKAEEKQDTTVHVSARGNADKAYLEGEGLIRLENVTYTTCKQGQDDVFVTAKELELDQVSGIGTATNAKVRFKDVPIFYIPKLTFPINDERKTGFLFPSIGSEQDSGFTMAVPWYWNIAPNQDATITPKLYADRGIQLGAEYRYLTRNSQGEFYGEVLPSDDEFNNETRSMVSYEHRQQLSENWKLVVDYNDVSDIEYFDDFSNDIDQFSTTFIPREASVQYSGKYWNVNTRFSEFQLVDRILDADGNDTLAFGPGPYERLPQISFNTYFPKTSHGIEYGVEGEITNFSDDSDTRFDGTRTDFTPSISLPLDNIWGFVTPKVSLRHTSYDLDQNNFQAFESTTVTNADGTTSEELTPLAFNDSPSRTTPVFSLDSGIFLEKSITWGSRSAIQTLEPRLFYVYIPDDDQDDLPNFDTGVNDLNNFSNIFRENRFSGRDRVGDTNQVTLGLTTRITDVETGEQRLKASIGQIYFLDDRTENLNPDEILTDSSSDFLAEISADFNDYWSASAFAQWDTEDSEVRNFRLNLDYELSDRKRFALRYRFSEAARDPLNPTALRRKTDQITFEGHWPLSERWQLSASERYSLETSESLQTKVSLEYNACCWRFRIGAENRVTRSFDEDRDAIFAELELTGLGSIKTGL